MALTFIAFLWSQQCNGILKKALKGQPAMNGNGFIYLLWQRRDKTFTFHLHEVYNCIP